MDRQAIFNKAANHMLEQGCKAYHDDDDNLCAYENSKGLMCAMGPFIPEGHPAKWTRMGIDSVIISYPELNDIFGCGVDMDGDFDQKDLAFLVGIQNIHDGERVEDWRNALNSYAMEHGLEGVGP